MHVAPFTPETQYILGNYYSSRGDNVKSVSHFKKCLALDSTFTQAYLLMGHEYLNMPNTYAAIQSYRSATGNSIMNN